MEKIDKKSLEDLRKLQLLELKIAKEIKQLLGNTSAGHDNTRQNKHYNC